MGTGKTIEAYFRQFPQIPEPDGLRMARRSDMRTNDPTDTVRIPRSTHPLEDNAPEYAHVGRIAVEWANLEAAIDAQIWKLLGAPEKLAACLTAQMIGPRPRLDALIAICIERGISQSGINQLNEFKKFAANIAESRNRFVHDAWHVVADERGQRTTRKRTLTARGRLRMQEEAIKDSDFSKLLYSVHRLYDIFEFMASNVLPHGQTGLRST